MSDLPRFTVSELAFGAGRARSPRGNEKVAFAIVLCPRREDAQNYYASLDGDPTKITNLPKSKVTLRGAPSERFNIAVMPGWLAKSRGFVQARQPGLHRQTEWTDGSRASWKALCQRLYEVRHELAELHAYRTGRKKPLVFQRSSCSKSGW